MSKHLKRLAAPRPLTLHRKEKTWTVKPSPGPHPLQQSIALNLIVRDYLQLCDTYREAKKIIADGLILVDNKQQKNHKFPVGLMDTISIPKMKKYYRILFDQRGKLTLVPITENEAQWKLCRIENKTTISKKKIQLNFHDGRNKLVEKDEFKTGDVVKLSLKDKKITDIYTFTKGNVSIIIGGKHIGSIAAIQDIQIVPSSKPNLALMDGETKFSTITKYVFPIGKNKPVINIPEVKM